MKTQDPLDRQKRLLDPRASNMIPNVRILVVGVGAVGNEVSKNLVLSGFGNITLIDFDHVEASNLSRTVLFRKEDIGKSKSFVAAQRLTEMALTEEPHIIGLHGNMMTDFGKGQLFLDHDIIILCVDTAKCRAFGSDWSVRTGKPFFEVGFDGFNLNVSFFAPVDGYRQVTDGHYIEKLPSEDGFFPRPIHPLTVCLREDLGQGSFEEVRNSCSGLKAADTMLSVIPTTQCISALASAIVTTELLKYLSGKDTLRNKTLFYYGLTHKTLEVCYKTSPNCTIHQENIPIETLEVSPDITIGQILSEITEHWQAFPLIELPSYVFSGRCACCGRPLTIGKLESEMYHVERWCDDCRQQYPDYETRNNYTNDWHTSPSELSPNSDSEFLRLHLSDIAVPTDDIVKVTLVKDNGVHSIRLRLKPKTQEV